MILPLSTKDQVTKAIAIKKECWGLDYPHILPIDTFDEEKNIEDVFSWLIDQNCCDVRKMYGFIVCDNMVGYISASFAEEEDSPNGVEINDLFVLPTYRRQGIAKSLMQQVLDVFLPLGKKELILYNYHFSLSNAMYHHMGGKVMQQITQEYKGHRNLTDVFTWDMKKLQQKLK